MAKFILIFFIALILLRTYAIRPEPRYLLSLSPNSFESLSPMELVDCKGVEREEECLMKRMLVDHTDYIYTQKDNDP
ncbi:hypothetical protein AMTRI_Chr10g6860 [Amborella trichopoda]